MQHLPWMKHWHFGSAWVCHGPTSRPQRAHRVLGKEAASRRYDADVDLFLAADSHCGLEDCLSDGHGAHAAKQEENG